MALRSFAFLSRDTLQAALAACALFASTAMVAPSIVYAQDDAATRLSRMEAQMDTLSRAVFKGDVPASAMPTPLTATSSDYQASVEARLSDLEKQNRELTGKVEQLTFDNSQLKTRLDKALTDIELRLQGQSQGQAAGNQMPSDDINTPTPTNLANTDDMSSIEPPKQSGTLSTHDMGGPVLSAPTPLVNNTEAKPIVKNGALDINAPAPADSPTIQNLGTMNAAPGGAIIPSEISKDATAQYESAFAQLKSGNYAPARVGFETFLKENATHPLAANATYWLGESYYGQGEFEKAARVFAESYKKYPKGPKVADSLLKMGMALGAGGKKKEACVTLQQLKKEFPSGQGVTLRRAEQEISKLACNR